MSFKDWQHVGDILQAAATEAGTYLNEGQRASLRVLAERLPQHGMVIADEVGMGKTRIAVALARAVVEAGGRVAILVPPTLGFQWQEELRLGGVSDVPDVVRSLGGFLAAWSVEGRLGKPWFDRSVLLVSHGFVTWRMGATTPRRRFEILPLLAGLAQQARDGRPPRGFKTKEQEADPLAWSAARSIARHCERSIDAATRRCFDTLGSETDWRDANQGTSYERDGASRRLLQTAVGLGLGAFDLVVIDEAHKSRGEGTGLGRLLGQSLLTTEAARRLCLTATPVELAASDWDQALYRIGIGVEDRMRVRAAVERYDTAARRVRLGWRGSETTRESYIEAARDFEAALQPYVLRRGKGGDPAVALFREASFAADGDPDAYRWQHDITVDPTRLELGWRRAVCAAESLSFVARGRDDPASKRLRLTFGNGHGIATQLDASAETEEDKALQPGNPVPEDAPEPAETALSPADGKRLARAAWWQSVIDRTARAADALYEHPAILAAVGAIEAYDAADEKVLVFGRFTGPMRALTDLLNARAMLRALDSGTLWPQRKIEDGKHHAAAAAHRQLKRAGFFDEAQINDLLAGQYEEIERRRDALRSALFDLILRGLPEAEHDVRLLAEAAKTGRDEDRALLAAAVDQLVRHGRRAGPEAAASVPSPSDLQPEPVAEAFLQLVSALRERGEGDADGDGALDPVEAGALWRTLAGRLEDEYKIERGRYARLMNGATPISTRRTLQFAFNRRESNPRVLVAQSVVGREGLNLHQACRVVILLHPEWNPGVVEQQVGRVDRVGSHWARELVAAHQSGALVLPRIEVRPVIFEGTYDAHHWRVLHDRWDDLRAQLHGIVVPHRLRPGCTEEERDAIRRLDAAAPNFEP